MLHAPYVVPIQTGKLDISLLLKSSPSPSPPPSTSRPPTYSRSISVPSSTALYPLISSPTSTTSHISTATAPANPSGHRERQSQGLPNTGAGFITPQRASNKRPPPTSPHQSASPGKKSNSKWSANENALIISLRLSGMKWEDISKRFPGRSAMSCRLHYQNYLERKCDFDDEMKDKMARLYDRLKSDMWTPIARDLGVPWRVVEAMHWHMGRDEMSRRAGVTPFALAGASGPSPSTISGSSLSTTGLGGGGTSSLSTESSGYGGGGGGGSLEGPERIRIKSESELRGEPRRRKRGESGVRGGTVLPSLAEMDVGVGVYDDDEDEEGENY